MLLERKLRVQFRWTSNNFCHPAHDDEQQQLLQQQPQYSNTQTSSSSSDSSSSGSSIGSSTQYVEMHARNIVRRTAVQCRVYQLLEEVLLRYSVVKPHGAKTKMRWKKHHTEKKRARWGSNHQLRVLMELQLPVQLLNLCYEICRIDMYLYVRKDTRDRNKTFVQKEKQHPSPGDDVSMAEAASGRVRRDEQGEARRANTTPNGVSHLELGHLRLKTCKSDFSTAETTPIHASISHNGIGPFFYQDIS